MKRFRLLALFLLFSVFSFTQNRDLNKAGVYYKQGNYRLAYWKADELINNPEYDTSMIPLYYKSISLFHLEGRFLFRKRNPEPWVEASNLFRELKSKQDAKVFFQKHKDEISELRDYLIEELEWLKTKNELKKADVLAKSIKGLFDGIKLHPAKSKIVNPQKENVEVKSTIIASENRLQLLDYAQQCIGVPYLFGGDSLDGFDCSGFTGYVYQNVAFKLGRSSRDQYQSCRKISKEEVQPGDLIFFNSGGEEVTHVGIIISNQGEPLKMIHSSTSKGVIITEIETSEYWMKKLTGFGTFF